MPRSEETQSVRYQVNNPKVDVKSQTPKYTFCRLFVVSDGLLGQQEPITGSLQLS